MMEEINDSIIIKSAETDEELCGRGYVHCTSWQEAYRGIVCDQYLDTMTVEATTARARNFPDNTLVASILFGICHLINIAGGAAVLTTTLQICFAVIYGFVLALIFIRSGSLIPCILFHALHDMCL